MSHDPTSEEASADLMRALGRAGNRSGVEKEYARLVRALSEDLDGEPLPETRRAYEQARAVRPDAGMRRDEPGERRAAKVVPLRRSRRRAPPEPGGD